MMGPTEFQVKARSQMHVPDEAAGGVSHSVLQPEKDWVQETPQVNVHSKNVTFIDRSCGVYDCVEGLRIWFSRIRLRKEVADAKGSIELSSTGSSNNVVSAVGSSSASLEAWYNDLFAKHIVLCKEHGKLKAEAEGWRTGSVTCQTRLEAEPQKASTEDAFSSAITAPKFAITSAALEPSNTSLMSTSSNSGPCPSMASAANTIEGVANLSVTRSHDESAAAPSIIERECSTWFEPEPIDLEYSTNNEFADIDVVTKAFAVVDGLRLAEAEELADIHNDSSFFPPELTDISRSEFASLFNQSPGVASEDRAPPEDSFEMEEYSTCVGSEVDSVNKMRKTSKMHESGELPCDTGEIVNSIQDKVKSTDFYNPFEEEHKRRGQISLLQNIYTTPEEEVGMDGCESARRRVTDRTNSRPFVAIQIHPNATRRPYEAPSHEPPSRETTEMPFQAWWACAEYKCRMMPSCQEVPLEEVN